MDRVNDCDTEHRSTSGDNDLSSRPTENGHHRLIRVVVQQPTLAKYRVPVFRELAQRDGIDLLVLYGQLPWIQNVEPDGFEARFVPTKCWKFGSQALLWHRAHLDAVDASTADVAIFSWSSRYLSLLPALRKAKRTGVASILWGHGYSQRDNVIRRGLRRAVARQGSAVLLYYDNIARDFIAAGWPSDRVFVAPNSIDQAPIERARQSWLADPQRLSQFRQQQGLDDGPVLLFVSRLTPENRLDLLVDAAAILRDRYPSVTAVIIGRGETEECRLRGMARRAGVEDNIRFLGAIYEEERLAPWFLSADLFVYPSNIGLSILHAFGYGLPVVTGDDSSAHNPEIVALKEGENGLLFRAGDSRALADCVAASLDRPDQLRALGAAAAKTVRDHFNLPRMVDGMERAIRHCATQGTAR